MISGTVAVTVMSRPSPTPPVLASDDTPSHGKSASACCQGKLTACGHDLHDAYVLQRPHFVALDNFCSCKTLDQVIRAGIAVANHHCRLAPVTLLHRLHWAIHITAAGRTPSCSALTDLDHNVITIRSHIRYESVACHSGASVVSDE